MQKIIDRFVKYVKIDTQSDPNNPAFPSTEKQWDLARILVEDLKEIGMQEVTIDENCYIMATLASNVDFKILTTHLLWFGMTTSASNFQPFPLVIIRRSAVDLRNTFTM